ncbi:MAG TPA: FkbM family methyltransferase [Planosporangium sp.]|jgi:FkbM family methyltransferase|nr:FkbM family methyltransferase [Planosporangium sp.]
MRSLALSSIAPTLGQRVPIRGPARLLNRSYGKIQARPGEAVRRLTTKFGDNFEADLSSFLEWQLWVFGAYEEHMAELFRYLVGPDATCIDVGANIGIHTTRLAKLVGPRGQVVAVEADEELARRARTNIALNHLTNVTVLHAAASDSGGDTRMLYRPSDPDSNKGRASLLPHPYLNGTAVPAPTVALDDVVHQPVALIKIDVEGHEAAVVAGARRIVAEHHPSIVFEYSPEMLGDSGSPAGWLVEQGYELFDIRQVRHPMTGRTRLGLTQLADLPSSATNILAAVGPVVTRVNPLVQTRPGRS